MFAYSQVEKLNEAEMCVYNYVVKNLKHILNLSVRELADYSQGTAPPIA